MNDEVWCSWEWNGETYGKICTKNAHWTLPFQIFKFSKGLLHLLSRCAENHDGYNSWSKWNKLNTIVKYHEMKLMSTDWSTIDPQKTLEDHSRFLMKLKTLAALCLLCQLLLVTVFCLHNFRQCLSSSMDKGCLPSHLWMCKGHLYNP